MKNPLQTIRGEVACKSCYEEARGDGDRCPIDEEPIREDEVFLDKHLRKEILQLLCRCVYEEYGCHWEGKVSEYEGHGKSCLFKPICCSLYKKDVSNQDIEQHLM